MEQQLVGADLTPYVPRIACAWERDAPDRTWQVIDGSLVFADISGFTALSERLAKRGPIGAEELTDVLGDCFAGLLAVAYAEGGSLLKFGGDALLLLFDGPGHELRAARAALGMRSSIRTIGRLTTSVGSVRLRMSQGVHSGDIHLFRVGASHKELVVCGPAATEVVRMESPADAGEVVVSEACAAALQNLAPAVVGAPKGAGRLLRANTIVHLVEGAYPAAVADTDAAASLPAVLRDFLATGGGESEHRHVAIAFVHFDGIDGVIAGDGPDAAASALDELAAVVQTAANAEDVTFLASDVDKDGGKCILVAGAPAAVEDADGRMLRTVRAIVDARRSPGVTVRVGVNRGHVFAGTVGPPYRRTYTVMGDAVNLAARLMAKARAGEIVVSPDVRELSRTSYEAFPLTPFAVKGKAAPVSAFLLGRPEGTQEPRRRERTPFVGRRRELARLIDVAAAGGVIDIVGDVGVGKTRLLEELRAAHSAPVRVVTCEQYERTTPYFAFGVLVRHVLSGPATAGDFRDAALSIDAELERWLPLLGDVSGFATEDTDATARLQPEHRRTLTAHAIERLLLGALDRGAVIAFDDVQWIDDASGDVLRALITAAVAGDAPWTICTTRRESEDGFVPPAGETLVVGALGDEEARVLAYTACGDIELAPHRAARIVRLAQGNPLFLEELVRMSADADHLPTTLDAVIASQIDALDPLSRRLLRQAAVLGDSFEPSLFAAIANTPAFGDPERLSARLQGMVVPTGDGRVAFRHRIIRDVAYRGLPFADRRDLHARAVHVIEQRHGDAIEERAEVLSMHAFHAQQFAKCWAYASAAADKALKKYALVEAHVLYERALAAAPRASTIEQADVAGAWMMFAKVLDGEGSFVAAQAALTKARRLSDDDPETQARLCGEHAGVALRMGRHTAASRWIMRGLRLLDGARSDGAMSQRGYLLTLHAWVRLQSGRPRAAAALADEALASATTVDDKRVTGLAHEVAEAAVMALGEGAAGHHGQQAAELFDELGEEMKLARMLNLLGAVAYFEGRWSDSLAFYERSAEKLDQIGCVVEAALARCNAAEIFADQGHLDEARSQLHEAAAAWRGMRFHVGVAFATRHLGRVALRSGDIDGAVALFTEARATLDAHGLRPKVLEVDTWTAECLLRRGDIDAARALLDAVLAEERSSGSFEMRAMIHRLRACVAATGGDIESAWAELDAGLAVAQERNLPFEIALALETMAAVAALGGRNVNADDTARRDAIVASLGITQLPQIPLSSRG